MYMVDVLNRMNTDEKSRFKELMPKEIPAIDLNIFKDGSLDEHKVTLRGMKLLISDMLHDSELDKFGLRYTGSLIYPIHPTIHKTVKNNTNLMNLQNAFLKIIDARTSPEKYTAEELNIILQLARDIITSVGYLFKE